MPRLKSVGGLPAQLMVVKITTGDIQQAEAKASYPLSETSRVELLVLCKLQSLSLVAQMLGGAFRSKDLAKFIEVSAELIATLPVLKDPDRILMIKPTSEALIEGSHGQPLAPEEFILRDLLEASLLVARNALAKGKRSPTKSVLWDLWVTVVSQVLSHHGLRTTASQHASMRKHDKESPFVLFLFELDNTIRARFLSVDLPAEAKALLPRPIRLISLAKAINRARKGKPQTLDLQTAIANWMAGNPFLGTAKYYAEKS